MTYFQDIPHTSYLFIFNVYVNYYCILFVFGSHAHVLHSKWSLLQRRINCYTFMLNLLLIKLLQF